MAKELVTFHFKGGREANGDPLYVARAKVDGVDSIGKVTVSYLENLYHENQTGEHQA